MITITKDAAHGALVELVTMPPCHGGGAGSSPACSAISRQIKKLVVDSLIMNFYYTISSAAAVFFLFLGRLPLVEVVFG